LAIYLLTDHNIAEDPHFHAFRGSEIEIYSETYRCMHGKAELTRHLPRGLLLVCMTGV